MKKLELYYVYDTIGDCAITGPIPVANQLVACIGFRDSFIKKSDSPYNYKALKLIKFGVLDVDSNGNLSISETFKVKNEINGSEIMDLIAAEMQARGVDDNLVDETTEE